VGRRCPIQSGATGAPHSTGSGFLLQTGGISVINSLYEGDSMNFTSFTVSAAVLLSSGVAVLGADQSTDGKSVKSAKTEKTKNAAPKRPVHKDVVTVTGSHLKRSVRQEGVIAVGPNPVYIIDHDSIRNSGASDLSQLLMRSGFRR
jgi:hypothetical protein